MHEIVFDSKLTENGTLYCPEEFRFKNAKYKVIVNIPEEYEIESNIEKSAVNGNSTDYLTKKNIKFYLNLEV